MLTKLSNCCSKYGAQMGRCDSVSEPNYPVKFHLVRMKMSSCGCYDEGGAYWGIGLPMYRAEGMGEEEMQEMFMRARSRNAAKEIVLEVFPNARFYK